MNGFPLKQLGYTRSYTALPPSQSSAAHPDVCPNSEDVIHYGGHRVWSFNPSTLFITDIWQDVGPLVPIFNISKCNTLSHVWQELHPICPISVLQVDHSLLTPLSFLIRYTLHDFFFFIKWTYSQWFSESASMSASASTDGYHTHFQRQCQHFVQDWMGITDTHCEWNASGA